MNTTLFLFFALVAVAITVAIKFAAAAKTKETTKKGDFAKRQVVTHNEQGMYWRLVECFPQPEFVVLAQVSFGALLNAKNGASRYSFSQKVADFVLLSKSFDVLAVIELDDRSHKGKEAADEARDAMLKQAGYKVLRYKTTPDRDRLKSDMR